MLNFFRKAYNKIYDLEPFGLGGSVMHFSKINNKVVGKAVAIRKVSLSNGDEGIAKKTIFKIYGEDRQDIIKKLSLPSINNAYKKRLYYFNKSIEKQNKNPDRD